MNAVPTALLRETAELSATVTRPIPGSRKIYMAGSRADLRVPMRAIALADTPSMFGTEQNAPFVVYDTSGPYTDPDYAVDLGAGLPMLRAPWVAERGDTELLADFTSPFTRRHAHARELAGVRFADIPHAAQRQIRDERLADALRAPRHHHAGNGIYRHPRKPNARSDRVRRACSSSIRDSRSARRCPRPSLPSSCAKKSPAAAPSSPPTSTILNRADDHRPQFPGQDQRQHRQFRRGLFH